MGNIRFCSYTIYNYIEGLEFYKKINHPQNIWGQLEIRDYDLHLIHLPVLFTAGWNENNKRF